MAGPDWFRWLLTAMFLAVAAYCLARLVVARHVSPRYLGCHRANDAAHGIMSLGMAVMSSPAGGPIPVAGWQAMFLVSTTWYLLAWWRQRAGDSVAEPIGWHGGGLHHVIAGVAMIYMLAAMSGGGHHMSAPWISGSHEVELRAPVIGWFLAAYFLVHATVLGVRTWRKAVARDGRLPAILTAPRLAAGCQVSMALGTCYMLVA